MANYDKKVLDCFLENQLQLFPEKVAETPEEADDFLEMMFAVVVKGKRGVRKYFEEVGYPHYYVEGHGTHSWEYWNKHITDSLNWLDGKLEEAKEG